MYPSRMEVLCMLACKRESELSWLHSVSTCERRYISAVVWAEGAGLHIIAARDDTGDGMVCRFV